MLESSFEAALPSNQTDYPTDMNLFELKFLRILLRHMVASLLP